MRETEYTPDEQRVCDYLQKITRGQMGCGDDPIGFLIASYDQLRRERAEWRRPMVANKVDPKLRKIFLVCLRPAAHMGDGRSGYEIDDVRDWDELTDREVDAISVRHRLNPDLRGFLYFVEPGTTKEEVAERVLDAAEEHRAHMYESGKNMG